MPSSKFAAFLLPMSFPKAFFTELSTAHEFLFTSRGRVQAAQGTLDGPTMRRAGIAVRPPFGRPEGDGVQRPPHRKTANIQGKQAKFDVDQKIPSTPRSFVSRETVNGLQRARQRSRSPRTIPLLNAGPVILLMRKVIHKDIHSEPSGPEGQQEPIPKGATSSVDAPRYPISPPATFRDPPTATGGGRALETTSLKFLMLFGGSWPL